MIVNYIQGVIDGITPTKLISVAEWADHNRYLSSISSAQPGLWRTDKTPYLREIMDNLSPRSRYQKIVVKKASQQGFTEAALNCVGTYIDISPSPILYIMPTVNMAKSLSKNRVKAMIDNCPALRKKIKPAWTRDGGNTLLEKEFPNGVFVLTGANSSSELSSRPIKVLILDEVDRYPLDVESEGSPIKLAEARTMTFGNRKIFMLSTPTNVGSSIIDMEIESTDRRKYYVGLPCCGTQQLLIFENLNWQKDNYKKTVYVCPHCGGEVEERHKSKFLLTGKWIATNPEKANDLVVGYEIDGMYSPLGWLSWRKIAMEFDGINNVPEKQKSFDNTILGRSYAESAEVPDYNNIANRAEGYKEGTVNNDVVFITAGADVQRDRIEIEVVGWCEGKESYSIEYIVFWGLTDEKKVWDELSIFIQKYYIRDDKVQLPIRLIAVDSGYNKNNVYSFCKRFDASKVIPVKGQDKQDTLVRTPSLVDVSYKGERIGRVKLWNVGVSIIKSEIYGWLRQNKNEDGTYPPGYCHFPQYGIDYFKGLTGEKLTYSVDSKGFRKYEWKKHYERNEPLDCRVYARAAAHIVGLDRFTPASWKKIRESLSLYTPTPVQVIGQVQAPETQKSAPQKKEGSIWD